MNSVMTPITAKLATLNAIPALYDEPACVFACGAERSFHMRSVVP